MEGNDVRKVYMKKKISCNFEKVIVIGQGKIVGEVLSHVLNNQKTYDYLVEYIEYGVFSLGTNYGDNDERVIYHRVKDKQETTAILLLITERTLIISAGNYYIFPSAVLDKPNIVIINFHNALLPKYPGQHAPTWAIFMNEKESGCTWHYVSEKIDGGAIIIQKKCMIDPDEKAYRLARKIMDLAMDAFVEIYNSVLSESAPSLQQETVTERRVFYSHERPNNGCFDLYDSPEMIYRLLRAMDWGPANLIMDNVYTTLPGGERIEIIRYSKITKADLAEVTDKLVIDMEKEQIMLSLDSEFCLRLKYQMKAPAVE